MRTHVFFGNGHELHGSVKGEARERRGPRRGAVSEGALEGDRGEERARETSEMGRRPPKQRCRRRHCRLCQASATLTSAEREPIRSNRSLVVQLGFIGERLGTSPSGKEDCCPQIRHLTITCPQIASIPSVKIGSYERHGG